MTLYFLQRSDIKRLPPVQEVCFFLLVAAVLALFILYVEMQKRGVKK